MHLVKPLMVFLFQMVPQVYHAKQVIERATGWSIFDPAEPLLVLAFFVCLASWFFSFFGWMEFRGYFTTFVLGVACSRVHLLGSLKEKLDRFTAENEKFRAANKDLKSNVNQLNSQNDKLQIANARLETAIKGLDEVSVVMQKYAAKAGEDFDHVISSLHSSIEEQKSIQRQTQEIEAQTRKLTLAQERSMLMNLFMQFQNQDGQQGLSREEFETLLDMLPEGSSAKLRNGVTEFKDVDIDGDGTISVANFRDWIRKMVNDMTDGSSMKLH